MPSFEFFSYPMSSLVRAQSFSTGWNAPCPGQTRTNSGSLENAERNKHCLPLFSCSPQFQLLFSHKIRSTYKSPRKTKSPVKTITGWSVAGWSVQQKLIPLVCGPGCMQTSRSQFPTLILIFHAAIPSVQIHIAIPCQDLHWIDTFAPSPQPANSLETTQKVGVNMRPVICVIFILFRLAISQNKHYNLAEHRFTIAFIFSFGNQWE